MKDGKRVVITYGTYDLFHHGHERLLERAKALGDYLIVGVTSDAFDRSRGKLNVFQPLSERLNAVLASGIADKVIVEEFQGQKISDIIKYGVDVFAIGSDWTGKFDYLKRYCDVVYLERTKGVSSTELRASRIHEVSIGCIGADYLVGRFVREAGHVPGAKLTHVLPLEGQDASELAGEHGLAVAGSLEELVCAVDAVYISAPVNMREGLIEAALNANCHVISESPAFLSLEACDRLHALAAEKRLVLMEGIKTLYFPAFQRLRLMLESGVIGEIKDIRASYSHVFDELDYTDKYEGSFYDMATYALLPAITLLGPDYLDARLICANRDGFNLWTKAEILYDTASATLSSGRGLKTEGDMVITGANGYIYVPAPWWKTEYFEVRGEDLRNTKKHYFECAGEGQRFEVFEFLARVANIAESGADHARYGVDETRAVTALVERFDKGDVAVLNSGKFHFGGGERVDDR